MHAEGPWHRVEDASVVDLRRVALLEQSPEGLAALDLLRAPAPLDQVRVRAVVGQHSLIHHALKVLEALVELA
jgi:hypothetical protein